jgi:hypothetical protein
MGTAMASLQFRFLLWAAAVALSANASQAQITDIKVHNPAGTSKTDASLTFGMVFKPGDVPAGQSLSASEGALQVDAKATHADGSLRHAVLTLKVPALAGGEIKSIHLSSAAPAGGAALTTADILKTDFDAKVTVTVAGLDFSASARDYLASAKPWLSGPLCGEWLATAPLKNAAGLAHPHLHARFAIRAYQGLKSIRVDVTVENDWAFEPAPGGFTYDVKIVTGGATYSKAAIAHTHHCRWRKVLWWGADPGLDYDYDHAYLISTGAFPYYDRHLKVAAAAVTALKEDFEPMTTGQITPYMPETGAHDDIGPLPNFSALYLLTGDVRALHSVLANGNCGGSFQIHYRHKASDLPVTIDEFPYMTILGNASDTRNPATGQLEAFPAVVNGLEKNTPDDAHQPSIAYLPYVLSGDYFYLEELQFWANWNMILGNPGYRLQATGLVKWAQNRGQAWSMRTLGQAAYITPDAHPLKKYFAAKVANNIDYYTKLYVGSSTVTGIGYLEGRHEYSPFGIAPWQDDFFTWSMGYLSQLGFDQVKPFLLYKSKFVVGRLTDPGFCWLHASAYSYQVGDSQMVPYKTLAQIYHANYPTGGCSGTAMDGYPEGPAGYPANMQPALAVAVDAGAPGAADAWAKYETRSPREDFTAQPQWDVVPKSVANSSVRPQAPARRAPAGLTWLLPGTPVGYRLDYPAKIFLEIFDTSGRQKFSVALGSKSKGEQRLDWARDVPGYAESGATPCLLRVKAVDDFNHSEYPAISTGVRPASR